jgi:hypothetical protein
LADELAPGGKYEGWRFATVDEVRAFVLNNISYLSDNINVSIMIKGSPLPEHYPNADQLKYEEHVAFTKMWGDTLSTIRGSRGIVGFKAIGLGGSLGQIVQGWHKPTNDIGFTGKDYLVYSDTKSAGDTKGDFIAWALVRQSCR